MTAVHIGKFHQFADKLARYCIVLDTGAAEINKVRSRCGAATLLAKLPPQVESKLRPCATKGHF